MTTEQQKDKIIEIVKKAIAENSLYDYDKESDEVVAQIDGDNVDHIAEEVADCVGEFASDRQTAYNEGYEKGCRSKMAYDYVACAKKYAVEDFAEMLIDDFIKSADNQELSTVKGVLKNVCPAKVNKIKKRFLKEYE